jgi:hypothetical protein
VPWSLDQRLAHNPSTEVIITFGPNWFTRFARSEPEQLDLVFGGPKYCQLAPGNAAPASGGAPGWPSTRQALRLADFPYRLHSRSCRRPGSPFYLVHGTGRKCVEVDRLRHRHDRPHPRGRGSQPWPGNLCLSERRVQDWKQRLDGPAGMADPVHIDAPFLAARAFYLDLQTCSAADPERWPHCVAPCPIRDADLRWFNIRRRRLHERMAIRTRERRPLLAISSQHVNDHWRHAPWCLRQPARFRLVRGSWSARSPGSEPQCPVPLSPYHVPFCEPPT